MVDKYLDTQLARITDWIKLFQRMSLSQKFMVFADSQKEAWYEGTVSEVTFEDLQYFADYELISEISAKDGIIVITCENADS